MNTVTQQERTRTNFFTAILVPVFAGLLAVIAWLPMTWQQQLTFGILLVAASLAAHRFFPSQRITHLLMLLSICATMRYAWWRFSTLYQYLYAPWSKPDILDAVLMFLLLAAEVYSFVILLLGYLQGIAPLQRRPQPLPVDVEEWPTVDVFIPTYNEPLDVVRVTALAATQIDWPADKLRVVILDDGEREEFREFARDAGVDYIARTEHSHAKAGNINHALRYSDSEYVAIFDSDHVATRSFLQMSIGWFLRDPKLGMLQTPHHFYSPDPIERNLDHFRTVPNEGELFYGVIQDGNDLWNATFFCGSCAVLRREALDEVGGIATETVTEDAHTSLRMQMKGWNTAYLNTVQAAGLATESLSAHVRQRTRWARGMIQILRTDNPLFARGLRPAQRLCYLNAMLHFLYAAPRLIFLSAPLIYLIFGKLNMPGYWVALLVFAAPHLVLSTVTNSRIQGRKRHTFWNEVYETILSPYILLPTWLAFINPRYGKFNVTAKGSQQESHFDLRIGTPFLALLALNVFGLAMAVPRYLYWNVEHRGTVLMNVIWTLFNIVVLGVTIAVCYEKRQQRSSVRIAAKMPVRITGGGVTVEASSDNVSWGGLAVSLPRKWMPSDEMHVSFPGEQQQVPIPARFVGRTGSLVRLCFGEMNIDEQLALTSVVFCRADRWLDWDRGRRSDSILGSFARVFGASLVGLRCALGVLFRTNPRPRPSPARALEASAPVVSILLIGGLALASARPVRAAEALDPVVAPGALHNNAAAGNEELRYPLMHNAGILLNQQAPSAAVRIVLPSTLLVESGVLSVRYHFPADISPEAATLQVTLNGNVIASLTPTASELASGQSSGDIPLPVDVFVQDSRLTFALPYARRSACSAEGPAAGNAWVQIDPASNVAVQGRKLKVASDLSLLPEPFVQRGSAGPIPLRFVFASTPDPTMLRAAGVAASWFGVQAMDYGPSFKVATGQLGEGNSVVFLTAAQQIPGVDAGAEASVIIQNNPLDPYGKLLVFRAPDGDQLLALVQDFASGNMHLEGAHAVPSGFELPAPRRPDDAPAWAQGNRVALSTIPGAQGLRSSAIDSALLYLRLAPDLNFGPQNQSWLGIRYNGGPDPLAPESNLAVSFNGNKANSVPIHATAPGTVSQAFVPLGDLPFAFRNTLALQLYPVLEGRDRCAPLPASFSGSISGGSWLDLGDAVHLARLPNLQMFANAGYPFTRYADLRETAVLLPAQPSDDALSMYLDLMGYFGAQTGYPALRVSVASAGDAAQFSQKDLLFLGAYADAAGLTGLTGNLPFRPWLGDALSLRARTALFVRNSLHLSALSSGALLAVGSSAEGLIETSASPYASGRTLVAVLGRPDNYAELSAAMLGSMPEDEISGSASLWTGDRFRSYRLSQQNYLVGQVPAYVRLEYWLAIDPWLPVLVLLLACAFAGYCIENWIAYRRRYRLMGLASDQALEVR